MLERDIVFEQHYGKRVEGWVQNAFNQGRSQGVMDILNIVQHFNDNDMPVTPKTILLFLRQMESQGQQVQPEPVVPKQNDNKCGEIEFPKEAEVIRLDAHRPKKPPKLEIIQ